MKKITTKIMMVTIVLMLSSCAQKIPTQSGFLSNYSHLKPLKNDPIVETSSSLDGSVKYAAVIKPAELLNNTNNLEIPKEEQQLLCEYLTNELTERFGEIIQENSDSDRTLIIRSAITGVDKSNPNINILSTILIFVPISGGGISIEIEAIDANTGKQIAALDGAYNGSLSTLSSFYETYGHAQDGIKELVEHFHLLLSSKTNS